MRIDAAASKIRTVATTLDSKSYKMLALEVEGRVALAKWNTKSACRRALVDGSVPIGAAIHSTSDHHGSGCPFGHPDLETERTRNPTSTRLRQRRWPRNPLPPRTTHNDGSRIVFNQWWNI